VEKYILATIPFPGASAPAVQIAKTTNLFEELSIENKSLLEPAEAALVPAKLIESQVISR
jgi:hypothetical protein